MKSISRIPLHLAAIGIGLALFSANAAEPESAVSASDLAKRLSAKEQDGNSIVRLRMTTPAGALQVQIKSRVTSESKNLVYQILFPKERKGEAVFLNRNGNRITGTLFTPPENIHALAGAQLDEPLFGSDLSYEDVIDNFFDWEQQAVVGTEEVDHVLYTILESKPGKGEHASYASVRSWIDPRRLVPLRIEKYSAPGKAARRIETTRVFTDDQGRVLPANLTVRGPRGSVTEFDGSRLIHGAKFTDADFSPEGFKSEKTSAAPAE